MQRTKVGPKVFGQVWGNSDKYPSHPQNMRAPPPMLQFVHLFFPY